MNAQVTPANFPKTVTLGDAHAEAKQVPEAKVEAAPVDEAKVTDKPLSPAFAALARKEKQMQKDREALKAEKAALEAERANFIPKSKLKDNLLAVLQEEGFTPEQLAQMVLNAPGPQDQTLTALRAEIAELKAGQQKTMSTFEEHQKQQYEHAVNQIRSEAQKLVETSEEYATIKEMGATEEVVELIKTTFDTEGKLLSVEEASKQVEDRLVEEALKMAGLSKVKAKLTAPLAEAQQLAQKTKQSAPLTTLTNAASAAPSKPLTAKDRRERAILAFKGQLTT